ncbi:hypothetical protein [Aquicoccus sp.]|uniref:hypothetical protein n=1 Tax=Aquicoccus sp. TaxID=2055851 RepID=UPI00356460D9
MQPFAKFHLATLIDLHKWSTLSRNEIRPFLARFGVEPLGSKYPMLRIYEAVLGISPTGALEDDMLGQGLIRLGEAAGMIGLGPDVFLERLRAKKNAFRPFYVFGPKRHLMLRAQVEAMLRSPRNSWHALDPISGHALPASRLARTLKVPQSLIDALMADKDDLPARIITDGRVRYIVADVAHKLTSPSSGEAPAAGEEPHATEPREDSTNAVLASTGGMAGGLFSAASKRANRQTYAPRSRTESGSNARGGDRAYGAPAEAKLSGT